MNNSTIINYSQLWEKIASFARKAGRFSTRPVLLLYYVLKSKDTPRKDKLVIVSALSYLLLPIDLISAKRLPIVGWFDEIISISVAYQKVCRHITPEMEEKVAAILDRWFPDYVSYELVEG